MIPRLYLFRSMISGKCRMLTAFVVGTVYSYFTSTMVIPDLHHLDMTSVGQRYPGT